MSNSNPFGGKLKKVLASMCSLFVGASGVSQADQPSTYLPGKLKIELPFGKEVSEFADFGWEALQGEQEIKKRDSWLIDGGRYRYQRLSDANGITVDVGFDCPNRDRCLFCIWCCDSPVCSVDIPKGVLFDVMRYFEGKYFPNVPVKEQVRNLSCAVAALGGKVENEIFLRFILWAFCGSPDAIRPNFSASLEELGAAILKFAIVADDPYDAGDKFGVMEVGKGVAIKRWAVLKPGYFLGNFYNRVREVYKGLKVEENANFLGQNRIGYALVALGGLVGGGALVEGAHRFFGAKRSGSSGKSKDKISSNGKNGQKAKNNLKK